MNRRKPRDRRDRQIARILASSALALTLLSGRAGRADDTHYQDYPVGGRAVGFGGAFAGLSDDPSGMFYNPAGIVDASRTSVQLSTTLYGLEIADTFLSAVEQVTDLNRVFTDLNVIPSSGSAISSIGELDEEGRARRSYGLGAFIPSYRSVSARNAGTIPEDQRFGGCDRLAYQRTLLDRSFYFGGSYAERIDDTWRFGVSGFLSYRALRDSEETSCFSTLAMPNQPFATAQTDLNMGVASVLLAFGLKADLSEGWTGGLNITTPGIRVFDTATLEVTRGSAEPTSGHTNFTVRQLSGIRASSKVGTSLRVGVAYTRPQVLTVAADAVINGPTRYRLFDPNLEGDPVREAITLVSNIERRMTANLSAGIEYLVAKPFSIAGGLFTNFSSAPPIPGERGDKFPESRLPYVNAYGGSFVLGFFSEHTLTRIGMTASYGSGSDVVPRFLGLGALGQKTEWVKIDLSRTFIYFFVSSTFRY